MKNLVIAMALLFSVAGFSQTKETKKQELKRTEKSANENRKRRNAKHEKRDRGQAREDGFMNRFKDLGLSDEQHKAIKEIFEAERENMKHNGGRFRGEGNDNSEGFNDEDRSQMREKMKERRQAIHEKVKKILTPEQYAKFKEQEQERMKEFRNR